MAYEIPLFKLGIFPADVDLSSESVEQFTAVKLHAAANVVGAGQGAAAIQASAGGVIIGVLQNNPIEGEACEIMAHGVSKIKAGGVFAAGDLLMVAAGGVFVLATSGNRAVAMATDVGAVGVVSSALIQDYGLIP